ncbi:MAG: hypothetical protein OEW68_13885, partial [Gammaproteobacteria bacterium]|nr:hypothetical protein [Gammaproteobacteria bacterium]
MRFAVSFLLLVLFALNLEYANAAEHSPPKQQQVAIEARYDEKLDAADMDAWLRRLSARPHHVGSTYGQENAQFIAGLFREWGYQVDIAEYRILLPTPKTRELKLTAPGQFTASLDEDTLDADPSTAVRDELLP